MEALTQEGRQILKNIFSILGISDLKLVRGVCARWNYLASPGFFRRSWCTVLADEDVGHWNDISRYMEAAEKSPSLKAINKIRLKHMDLTDKNNRTTRVIEFFEQFGKGLKALNISRCRLDKGGELWINLVRISKWTPNLQELILDENCFIDMDKPPDTWGLPSRHKIKTLRLLSDKSDGSMPCLLNEFWREFPFLVTLQLVDLTEEENLILLKTFGARKVSSATSLMTIKEMDIFGEKEYSVREIPSNQFKLFCNLKFPLTKLTIDIGENILPINFQQLLLDIGSTLKEFVIWRGLLGKKLKNPGFPFGITLPQLEFLEVPENCLTSFNFIQYVPKLLNLTIRQCDLNPVSYETDLFGIRYTYKEWRAFVNKPHKLLQELKIEFKITDNNIEFLKDIFPNVRILSGFINAEDMDRIIF